METRQMPGVS